MLNDSGWRLGGSLTLAVQNPIDKHLFCPAPGSQLQLGADHLQLVAFELTQQLFEVELPGPDEGVNVVGYDSAIGDFKLEVGGQVSEATSDEAVEDLSPFFSGLNGGRWA